MEEVGPPVSTLENEKKAGGPLRVLQLVKAIDVRWNSMYNCICRLIQLKDACVKYFDWFQVSTINISSFAFL